MRAELLERLVVQQPGEARRGRAGGGAAQGHGAARAQSLLDERVLQLRRGICAHARARARAEPRYDIASTRSIRSNYFGEDEIRKYVQ